MSRFEKPKGYWIGALSGCAMFAMIGVLFSLKHADPFDLLVFLSVDTVLFINMVWCWTCT
jgi:hypothetical protein